MSAMASFSSAFALYLFLTTREHILINDKTRCPGGSVMEYEGPGLYPEWAGFCSKATLYVRSQIIEPLLVTVSLYKMTCILQVRIS